jgi:large subunit ribosomal protein L31
MGFAGFASTRRLPTIKMIGRAEITLHVSRPHFLSLGRRENNRIARAMKTGIHPEYRDVVFHDTAANEKWITRSTLHTSRKITMDDGKEYPLVILEISSMSHPFYTGKQQRILDTAGRVERFNKKYAKKEAA